MELVPVLRWLVVCAVLAGLASPVVFALFPDAPDAGLSLAFPVGLGVVTLIAFWVGHLSTLVGMVAGVVALVALAALAVRRGPQFDRPSIPQLGAPVVVFAVAFSFVLLVRAVDPGIVAAGGEKFLDYSLVRAVLRADALPPEDPWFAGEPLRYYYGGPLAVAIITRASGVAPPIAYNLAIATAFGALATGAYGVAAHLAAEIDRSPVAAGSLGAALTAFGGTLAAPLRALWGLLPRDFAYQYGHALVAGIRVPAEYSGKMAEIRFLAPGNAGGYSIWNARYVVPGVPNVTPLWTFLNGDLRAHMIAPAFLLVGVASAAVCYRSSDVDRRRIHLLGVLPAVGGLIAVVNTWTLPVIPGLVVLALGAARSPPRELLPSSLRAVVGDGGPWYVAEGRRLLVATALAAAVGLLAAAWAAPFLLAPSPVNRGVHLLPPRSPLDLWLLVHGGFLGLFALAFLPRLADAIGWSRWEVAGAVAIPVVISTALGGTLGPPLVALFAVGLGWIVARADRSAGFAPVLVVAGAGLLAVTELAAARVYPFDPNAPRWNTVYKLSIQIWVLWGPAGALAALAVLDRGRTLVTRADVPTADRLRSGAGSAATVLLVAGLLSFGVLGAAAALSPITDSGQERLHLDGTDHVSTYHPDEAVVIEWLEEREGTPTVLAKPGTRPYTWESPLSSLTGVPTVAGWTHEIGYRGEAAYDRRTRHVRAMYTASWDRRRQLLVRYDVRYVYVGPREREAFDARASDFLRHDGFRVAVGSGRAVLLAVDQSALSPPANGTG